jgi:endoglycosylceramidase
MKIKHALPVHRSLLLAIFIFLCTISDSLALRDAAPRLDRIRIRGKWFVDESDRVVIFHGLNAVKKEAPWIPDAWNQTHLEQLKSWGFNVIRLGVMWAGLMPKKNYVNQTYLDEMVKMVDDFEAHGFYVIIDLHQDMLSSKL